MDHWAEFNGAFVYKNGFSPLALDPADFTDAVFYWCVNGMDEKERVKFELELTIPPANIAPEADDPMWSAEAEMALFRKGASR